jgi:hypothetical protein
MRRILLVLFVVALGCRRTHPPGPGAEPEAPPTPASPSEPAAPAAPAAPTEQTAPPSSPSAPQLPRFAMPDGGTLNGDPRGPREAEVKPILDRALLDVRACFDGAALKPGEIPVSVHFFVEPPGYTGAVTVTAEAPREALDCTRAVYEKLKFREFRGPKIELTRGFTYWKKALGQDGGVKG